MEDSVFDVISGQVNLGGSKHQLTKIESRLFGLLYLHAGDVVDYDTLTTKVWGEEYLNETKYLQDYIRLLRRKIETDPKHPRYILNIRGFGYKLNLTK